MYCAEQIVIPADLPDILKNYTKHIIRAQPSDIMSYSAEYFDRLALQKQQSEKKLSSIQLESFYIKFARLDKSSVSKKEIEEGCSSASVPNFQMMDILKLGGWNGEKIPWMSFWALLMASASGNLVATMENVCKILGDNGLVPSAPVIEVIKFLASRDPLYDVTRTNKITSPLSNSSNVEIDTVMKLIRSA